MLFLQAQYAVDFIDLPTAAFGVIAHRHDGQCVGCLGGCLDGLFCLDIKYIIGPVANNDIELGAHAVGGKTFNFE